MSDQEIEQLEEQIPELAERAVEDAVKRTFASGQSVLHESDGKIYKALPDGSREFVKNITPPTEARIGQVLVIE